MATRSLIVIASLLVVLWSFPAVAQNPQCPTPALGGSSPIANGPTCASQAFVTNHFPGSSTAGHPAVFADSSGQLLADGGNPPGLSVLAFAALPACNGGAQGYVAFITNSNTSTFNATITGTGSNIGLAVCNGTNWTFH